MPTTQSAARKREAPPPITSPDNTQPANLPPVDLARLYRVRHAAQYLDVSVSYAYKLIKNGLLRTVDCGGQRVSGAEIARIAGQHAEGLTNA